MAAVVCKFQKEQCDPVTDRVHKMAILGVNQGGLQVNARFVFHISVIANAIDMEISLLSFLYVC